MLYKHKQAEEYAEKVHDVAKNVPEVKELAFKAKYFTRLEQDYKKALDFIENLDPFFKSDYANICLAVCPLFSVISANDDKFSSPQNRTLIS